MTDYLYISEPDPRDSGPILVCDADHNDVAEFFHNEHATVPIPYETALDLARILVRDHIADAIRALKTSALPQAHHEDGK